MNSTPKSARSPDSPATLLLTFTGLALVLGLMLVGTKAALGKQAALPSRGVVLELGTDAPVADAQVVVKWTLHGSGLVDSGSTCLGVAYARTDARGKFSLPARPYTFPWADVSYQAAVYKSGYVGSMALARQRQEERVAPLQEAPAGSRAVTAPDHASDTKAAVEAARDPRRAALEREFSRAGNAFLAEERKGILRVERARNLDERFGAFSELSATSACTLGENLVNPQEVSLNQEILRDAQGIAATPAQRQFVELQERRAHPVPARPEYLDGWP